MHTLSPNFIEGIFVRELKNRFLCEVRIGDVLMLCYVPTSCHLSNFLELNGREVLLVPTQNPKARTKYALFAVRHKRSYILLNSSIANRVIENNLCGRHFSFLAARTSIMKEYRVHGYKADLYVQDTDTIIEVKSVISTEQTAAFPTVPSDRRQKQLHQLKQLLLDGHKVCYCLVSLSPYVQKIDIAQDTEFFDSFIHCVELGMKVVAYSCRLKNAELTLAKRLPVVWNNIINQLE